MNERRASPRHELWFPLKCETEGVSTDAMAICHDTSSTGMLLALAQPMQIGSALRLRFKLPDESTERVVAGTVVRFEKDAQDPCGLWPHLAAITFDEPSAEIAEAVERSRDFRRPSVPPASRR